MQTQESTPAIQTPTPIPNNAIQHGACGKWWSGAERSHASCCHETFSSLTAFERHRRGMRCNDPASVGLVARQKPYGTLWGLPGPANGYAAIHGDEERES
ncbi:hypothetical protein OG897_13405 [Streptomyces sp. NBC_00237]|uniref:FDXHR family putative zinc-binding protein n=1 Tax=Streptomyces sp. NBC_00237 TaxID=2975687 RepID=UPI002256199B|nr:hypothetical protein [Streptomyces sp. NBC_00237]MCX5202440.1 hypothetical protein [Streptomyces sp. NBC_00237]